MDKSDNLDSSIAEEEHIISYNFQPDPQQPQQQRKYRYANMKEIKNFQRLADAYNQKLIDNHPTIFKYDALNTHPIHFIANQSEEYFLTGEKEDAKHTVSKNQGVWEIKLPITNIHRQSILKIQLGKMKTNRTLTLQNRSIRSGKTIRFKYTLTLLQGNLILRVWVELEGSYKIWKQMEVPISQNKIFLEFRQFNNEQTDVKVNDYLFHLILKMPYEVQSHYCIIIDENIEIERIQLSIVGEGKSIDDMDTNCSKQCQLI